MHPVLLSLGVATAATALAATPAIALGAWLARTASPWRWPMQVAAMAPLVVPPVFTGWALLTLTAPVGLPFTTGAAVLAQAVVGFPLFVRAVQVAVAGVPRELEEAAATLGAPPARVWRTITLPLAWPGLVAGALLAWARALGEFGATLLVAGNVEGVSRTVPLALYTALQTPGGDPTPWAWWSLALSGVGLVGAEVLTRRWTASP